MGGANGGKIAVGGVIDTLLVVHALDEFGDDDVHVGIALAVAMAAQVDGHAVEAGGEVRAVIEVEAAREVLVGFAAAGVLGDDDAGDHFQNFAGA